LKGKVGGLTDGIGREGAGVRRRAVDDDQINVPPSVRRRDLKVGHSVSMRVGLR
jgi:hypothetical protein